MKRKVGLIVTGLLLLWALPRTARADEGMWLMHLMAQVNYETMKAEGLQLTADQLYSEDRPSIKDAIVALDRGSCSGSMISEKGLMITNHHCAYGDIQKLSTLEHDYLKDGFWARTPEEEIVIPGKTVMFLENVVDVTDEYKEILANNKGKYTTFSSRRANGLIQKKYARKGYEVSCEAMLRGDKYYLYYYKVYKDVRLVGAPSAKIGAFGGDTDNWSWPQHKGDFSLYRVYGDKEGNPAEYSKENVPICPKYVLPVSRSGLKDRDFAMLMGYPGVTTRYMPAWGVKHKTEVDNPAKIDVRTIKLALMREAMNEDPQVKIQYASKYFGASNYWKYAIGENKYIQLYDVFGIKSREEAEMARWINADPDRKARYGNLLDDLRKCYEFAIRYEPSGEYHQEAIVNGADVFHLALRFNSVVRSLEKQKCKKMERNCKDCEVLRKLCNEHFKDYNEGLDRRIFAAMLKLYCEKVDEQFMPDEIPALVKKYKGNYEKLTDDLYERSFLSNREKVFAALDKGITIPLIQNDPLVKLLNVMVEKNHGFREFVTDNQRDIRKLKMDYEAVYVEMNRGKKAIYPDANSTMRITYGTVGGYVPKDAVNYEAHSSIAGYTEKYKAGDPEFDLPADFLPAVQKGDWGAYADTDGKLYTGFVTNQDITGGNSGSAVMNAKGELVGLAYDGNWESMAGAVYFHPDFNKSVCVDIRFVLWLIDKYAGASYLIDEMKIVD